jgi:TolB-like protein/class 3 adenylate cyclase/Tfp pilus assembly protein PilF
MAGERMRRRLAAIIAADIAGFSKLVAHDEEGTLSALRAHRRDLIDPKISEYNGRIANTAGDSILAEFPSVVDALRCAMEVQRGMAERNAHVPLESGIAFRIGINLGDVVEHEGDLLGDGVNVAARLEALAQPGGICVSRAARDQVRDKLNVAFDDLGEIEVKNIARRVRVFSVREPSAQRRRTWLRRVSVTSPVALIPLAAVFGIGLAFAAWPIIVQRDEVNLGSSVASRPSISVIPFSNLGNGPEQDYFSEGVTTDLIRNLSRFRELFVISSNTALHLKGKSAAEVGRELGVRYVLVGSVHKSDDRVRINVQMIETETGRHLWAEQYDERVADLFDLQDRLASQIVRKLAVQLSRIERQRAFASPTRNLKAYDYVLRGRALLRHSKRAETFEARRMFEKALSLDSSYPQAYIGLGTTYLESVLNGWTEWPQSDLDAARQLAVKALTIDGAMDEAHGLLATIYLLRKQYDAALVESERAIALNPNDPANYARQGAIHLWAGRIDGAVRALEAAHRFDPLMGVRPLAHLGMAYYLKRRYQDAAKVLERGRAINPDYAYALTVLAATYGQLGDDDRANEAISELRRVDPFFSIKSVGRLFRDKDDTATLVEGLQKAGIR